jgi:hypothetical protein
MRTKFWFGIRKGKDNSDCSTFLIMCDVPSTVVFFVENLLNAFLVLFPDFF